MKQLHKVEIEKMRQLADFLETVPPEEFDLSVWQLRAEQPRKTLLFGLIETNPGCGFAGCAMGWAAHSTLFPGLRLTRIRGTARPYWEPSYRGHVNWAAVELLFGLTVRFSAYLFRRARYKGHASPGQVADRLRAAAERIERWKARAELRAAPKAELRPLPMELTRFLVDA
jgi:hypothetical protein